MTENIPNDSELAILLWNVWNLPSWLTDNKSHTRALQISPLLNDYAVVVLNEAFCNHAALLAKVTHKYKFIPKRPWNCIFSPGLIFLSRHEIVASGYEKFASRIGVDKFAGKGIAYIEIRVPSPAADKHTRLRIYGTHMQASYGHSAQMTRMSQARQIGRLVSHSSSSSGSSSGTTTTASNVDDKTHCVLVGDMNMGPKRSNNAPGWSQHYFDADDANGRTSAYQALLDSSSLLDVSAFTAPERDRHEYSNEICRVLVSRGLVSAHEFAYVLQPFTDGGNRLSDTKALCLHLDLSSLDTSSTI